MDVSAGERSKTYALDRAATGTGVSMLVGRFHPFTGHEGP